MLQRLIRRWRARTAPPPFADPQLASYMPRNAARLSDTARSALIDRLLARYAADSEIAQSAGEVRRAILTLLQSEPQMLRQDRLARFVAEHVQPADLDTLQWEHPDELLDFYAALYAFNSDTGEHAEQLRSHAYQLIHTELLRSEQQERYEDLLTLLRFAPAPPGLDPAELAHLQHLARLHESRRILRNRRWLYSYLIVQALLVLIVFPPLFQNAENGAIQRQIKQATDVEMANENYRLFSYPTALYWTVITATSIGYGDITPLTDMGRAIAAVLGTMGVVTIGVVGGLVLRWISPRHPS